MVTLESIALEDITVGDLGNIYEGYADVAYGNRTGAKLISSEQINDYNDYSKEEVYEFFLSDYLDYLKKTRKLELRLGSIWEGHSKLFIYYSFGLRIEFRPNFRPQDRTNDNPLYVNAVEAGKLFDKKVEEYFSNRANIA